MNPHLPPDEAIVAGLVLVLIFFLAIWWVEYWK
jgi:hypothetical protein